MSVGARLRRVLPGIATSVAAAVLATLIAGLGVLLLGRNPIAVIGTLVTAPLADPYRIADSLGRSCPLILCGLAVAIAFRGQAWNIGVEGQYLLGAIASTAVGVSCTNWPGALLLPAMLIAATVSGGLFAVPASVLENRRNVPLVLSTILLNFVAVSLVSYLTQGPLRGSDPSAAQSDRIAAQANLPPIIAGTDLHWGLPLALIAAVAMCLVLARSVYGFELRVVGLNPTAASWCGMSVPRTKLIAMLISGGLGGLAGGIQVAGITHLLNIQASEGFGYVAIAVALLGRLHPAGVVAAAIAIALLDTGASQLERNASLGVPADLAQVIKGIVVLAVLVLSGPRVSRWTRRMLDEQNRGGDFAPIPADRGGDAAPTAYAHAEVRRTGSVA